MTVAHIDGQISRNQEAYIKLSENMSIIENVVATSKGGK